MKGLVALVPLAELLADLTGSRAGATRRALELLARGAEAAPRPHDDIAVATLHELIRAGVLTEAGVANTARAAELIAVCEILAASTVPTTNPLPGPRLVLTAPAGSVPIRDDERLDALVLDVIRRATGSLHIGGAFWNDDGFERLDDVLLPALRVRQVATTIYVNIPDAEHRSVLDHRLAGLCVAGPFTVRWFTGPRPTMLHAKFVVADRHLGYLGTANLTSWGLTSHIEAGVELTAGQSERFVTFLEQLEAAGLFAAHPSTIFP